MASIASVTSVSSVVIVTSVSNVVSVTSIASIANIASIAGIASVASICSISSIAYHGLDPGVQGVALVVESHQLGQGQAVPQPGDLHHFYTGKCRLCWDPL